MQGEPVISEPVIPDIDLQCTSAHSTSLTYTVSLSRVMHTTIDG
jgi:hypothetical protein